MSGIDVFQIRRMARGGMTLAQISLQTGLSVSTISRRLILSGFSKRALRGGRPSSRLRRIDPAGAALMRSQGMTLHAIGRFYGASAAGVCLCLHRAYGTTCPATLKNLL